MPDDTRPVIAGEARYSSADVPPDARYVIVNAMTAERMVMAVEALMRAGFSPVGGHSMSPAVGWSQALLRGK